MLIDYFSSSYELLSLEISIIYFRDWARRIIDAMMTVEIEATNEASWMRAIGLWIFTPGAFQYARAVVKAISVAALRFSQYADV